MANFSIENFGCRATEADAAALRRELLASGLTQAEHASADIVVLNTCTVTGAADSQAREAVRKIHRANPAARIIVTGCYAQRAPEELTAIDGVTWVVGNSHQAEIPGLVRGMLAPATPGVMPLAGSPARILAGDILAQTTVQIAPASLMADDRTRPILKVQDGCNNRCSYCVIPFVRGRSRSLPPEAVVGEVRMLVAAGAKEIVLSGINLGSYGRDLTPRAELSSVVRRILDETGLEMLRFSSIEPQDITEDFVALVASSNRLAPHFHVPLQSGSDRILRRMHRWYRSEHYAERVSVIRRRLPSAAVGADVIVGFPGETEEDFRDTREFIERLSFTYLHVFSFSTRPGTAAAGLGDAVPPQVIRERARALRELARQKSAAFRASQAGNALRALTLHTGGGDWTDALTGNYLKLRIAGRHAANEWCEAFVTRDPEECLEAVVPGETRLIASAAIGTSAL